jgi:hypothetical protein
LSSNPSRNTIVIGGHIRSFTTRSIPEHFNQDIAVLMPAFYDVVLKAEETLQNAAVRGKQWAAGQKQTCEPLMSSYSSRCN